MKKRTAAQKLSEALLKLAEKKNIEKITIKEIVQECGLSSQTFYNHFSDKYALVLYIHQSAGEEMMQKLVCDETYTFRSFLMDNLTFYAEHSLFLLNVLKNTSGSDSYYIASSEYGIQSLTDYIRNVYCVEELSEEEKIHLRMYLYGCTEICTNWVEQGMNIPAEHIADYLAEAIPSSLRPYLR